ncbi:hypothetical protein V6N13_054237 [Hibiscus sabdariffa]
MSFAYKYVRPLPIVYSFPLLTDYLFQLLITISDKKNKNKKVVEFEKEKGADSKGKMKKIWEFEECRQESPEPKAAEGIPLRYPPPYNPYYMHKMRPTEWVEENLDDMPDFDPDDEENAYKSDDYADYDRRSSEIE